MLLSTKDQGLGRKRRSYSYSSVYSNNKARISKMSLLSSGTTQSSGSNGSNSTVTQESYNKSRSEAGKKRRMKRKKDAIVKQTTMEPVDEEAVSDEESSTDNVDVFAFLVPEEDGKGGKEEREDPVPVFEDEQDQDPSQSTHSDSGISMDDGSFHLCQATLKPLLPTLEEEQRPKSSHTLSIPSMTDWKWPPIPQPLTQGPIMLDAHPPAFLDVRSNSGHYAYEPGPEFFGSAADRPTHESEPQCEDGCDRDTPCSNKLPVDIRLRKFRRANMRVLLNLQEDISGLEREVRELDSALAVRQRHSDSPSSRRASWTWDQPRLDAARAEALHRLQLRLETYYKHVMLAKKIERLETTSSSGIGLEQVNGVLAHADLGPFAFDANDDLFTISNSNSESTESGFPPAIVICLTIVGPLMLFKVFTGLLNRAIIVATSFAVGLCVVHQLQSMLSLLGVSERVDAKGKKRLRHLAMVGGLSSMLIALLG